MENKKFFYHLLGIIILCYFTIFLKLDSFHIRWWDESLFAVNSYEMIHNGKFFSAYYDGQADLFNSKPPMTSWLQIIFIKILGYNELAIRLPSAISATLCILILFGYLAKNFNILWAWLSALVLLTANGFTDFHTARTGDSDSILTLFLLLSNLFFVKYILEGSSRNVFLVLLFLTFSFMTKMYIPLLFCPAYLIILIREKKVKDFVLNKYFFTGLLLFLLINIGLVFLRDSDSPGYLKKFLSSSEILYSVVHNHEEPIDFYIGNFFSYRFACWFVMSIVGMCFTMFLKEEKEKKTLFSLIILCFAYLVVITISKTKLEWYDMPLYPYLAALAGFGLYKIFKETKLIGDQQKQMLFIIIIIFSYPYYYMFEKSQGNTIPPGEKILEANERYIFKQIKEHKNIDGLKVYHYEHHGSLLFYKYKLSDAGQRIEITKTANFNLNDNILVSNDSLKKVLKGKYSLTMIDKYDQAEVYKIEEKL